MSTKLIPIAISSQLDVTGEERIHAAPMTAAEGQLTRPTLLRISGDLPDLGKPGDTVDFSYQVEGAAEPYIVEIITGPLPVQEYIPEGLVMDTNGAITGIRTNTGQFDWEVQVSDSLGRTLSLVDSSKTREAPTLWIEQKYYTGPEDNLIATVGTPPINIDSEGGGTSPAHASDDGLIVCAMTSAAQHIYRWNEIAVEYQQQTITGQVTITDGAGQKCAVSPDGEWVLICRTYSGDTNDCYSYKDGGSSFSLIGTFNIAPLSATQISGIIWNDTGTHFATIDLGGTLRVFSFNTVTGVGTQVTSIATDRRGPGIDWQGNYIVVGGNGGGGTGSTIRVYSFISNVLTLVCTGDTSTLSESVWLAPDLSVVYSKTDNTVAVHRLNITGGTLQMVNSYTVPFSSTAVPLMTNKDRTYFYVGGLAPSTNGRIYAANGEALTDLGAIVGGHVGFWTNLL